MAETDTQRIRLARKPIVKAFGVYDPLTALVASELYGSLNAHGSSEPCRDRVLDLDRINRFVGTPEAMALGRRYEGAPPPKEPNAP
jgi:hypothetical protein